MEKGRMSTRSKGETPTKSESESPRISPRKKLAPGSAGAARASNVQKAKDGSIIYKRRNSGGLSTPDKDNVATETEVVAPALRKRSSDDSPVVGSRVAKRMRTVHVNSSGETVDSDAFCWTCHKEAQDVFCEICPRVYHTKCLGVDDVAADWVCPVCEKILQAECVESRSRAMSLLSLDQLCVLLKYALQRMKHSDSEDFHKPVDSGAVPHYTDYIFHPMDLSTLEKNIRKKLYGSTEAFLADARYILHNCIIFNGEQSKLTSGAKMILKICKHEMSEIEICPDCYLNSCTQQLENWFCEPCRNPHTLVWAKMKGYPFWPAKALRELGSQVDVRFFGEHDRAWVPVSQVFLLSKEPPAAVKKGRGGYDKSMEELELHISKLRSKFGSFEYAPHKMLYDPEAILKSSKAKTTPPKGRRPSKSSSTDSTPTRTKPTPAPKTPEKHTSITTKTASAVKLKYNSIISTRNSKEKGRTIGDNVQSPSSPGRFPHRKALAKTSNSATDVNPAEESKDKSEMNDASGDNGEVSKSADDEQKEGEMDSTLDSAETEDEPVSKRQKVSPEFSSVGEGDDVDLVMETDQDDTSVAKQDMPADSDPGVSEKSPKIVTPEKLEGDEPEQNSSPKPSEESSSKPEENKLKVFLLEDKELEAVQPKSDIGVALEIVPKTKSVPTDILSKLEDKIQQLQEDDTGAKSGEEGNPTAESQENDTAGEGMKESDCGEKCGADPGEAPGAKSDQSDAPGEEESAKVDTTSSTAVCSTLGNTSDVAPTKRIVERLPSSEEPSDLNTVKVTSPSRKSSLEPNQLDSGPKNELLEKLVASCKEKLGVEPDQIGEDTSNTSSVAGSESTEDDSSTNDTSDVEAVESHTSTNTPDIVDLDEVSEAGQEKPTEDRAVTPTEEAQVTKSSQEKNQEKNQSSPDEKSSECRDGTTATATDVKPADAIRESSETGQDRSMDSAKGSPSESFSDAVRPHGTEVMMETGSVNSESDSSAMVIDLDTAETEPEKSQKSSVDGEKPVDEKKGVQTQQASKVSSIHRDSSDELREEAESQKSDEKESQMARRKSGSGQRETSPILVGEIAPTISQSPGTTAKPMKSVTTVRPAILTQTTKSQAQVPPSKPQTATVLPEKVVPLPGARVTPGGASDMMLAEDVVPKVNVSGLDLSKYNDKISHAVRETMLEMCDDMISAEPGSTFRRHLQLEAQRLQWRHQQEIAEIKHTANLKLLEIRASMELEKDKAMDKVIHELRVKFEIEKRQAIDETKKKQWCAMCGKEAIFYCCWNTSYCDYPCQQAHWPQHMSSCTQSQGSQQSADTETGQSEVRSGSVGKGVSLEPYKPSNHSNEQNNTKRVFQRSSVVNAATPARPFHRPPTSQQVIGPPLVQYLQPGPGQMYQRAPSNQQFQLGNLNSIQRPPVIMSMVTTGTTHQSPLGPHVSNLGQPTPPQPVLLPQGARLVAPNPMQGSSVFRHAGY